MGENLSVQANPRGIGGWILAMATLWLAVGASASALPLTAASTADALDVSMSYLRSHRVAMGFEAGDLEDIAVTDRYRTARSGLTHGSVRVNLHRGMRLLRERLGGETS